MPSSSPVATADATWLVVVGLRSLEVPIPEQVTKITCTLNNGIHFVTTPEAPLARECSIDQEFELCVNSTFHVLMN